MRNRLESSFGGGLISVLGNLSLGNSAGSFSGGEKTFYCAGLVAVQMCYHHVVCFGGFNFKGEFSQHVNPGACDMIKIQCGILSVYLKFNIFNQHLSVK